MGGKPKGKVVVGGAVPFKVRDELDKIARLKGINRSAVIADALTQYTRQHGKRQSDEH